MSRYYAEYDCGELTALTEVVGEEQVRWYDFNEKTWKQVKDWPNLGPSWELYKKDCDNDDMTFKFICRSEKKAEEFIFLHNL
jgi:hypothetical protein